MASDGNHPCKYFDSEGVPKIGIGFNLRRDDAREMITNVGADFDKILSKDQCLNPTQIHELFQADLEIASSGARRCISSFESHHSCIQNVLTDMTFNMGPDALCSWPNFIAQLDNEDYDAAAENIESTEWCEKAGDRCTRSVYYLRQC